MVDWNELMKANPAVSETLDSIYAEIESERCLAVPVTEVKADWEVENTKVRVSHVTISICDVLNPSIGYQIRITDMIGNDFLFTSRDPADGKPLLTYADALRVASYYV